MHNINEKDYWGKVDIKGMDDCWNWKVPRYPRPLYFRHTASRIAWTLSHETGAGDLQVLHTCHNTQCVNPSHLRLGTSAENQQDKPTSAPLETVRRIRVEWQKDSSYGRQAAIARLFGVPVTTVYNIVNNRTFKNVV